MASISLTTRLLVTGPDGTEVEFDYHNKQVTGLTAYSATWHRFSGSDTITVFDPTNDNLNPILDFDFLYIYAKTGNVDVEFTCNEGNANEALSVVRVVAGVPLVLGADDSIYGTAANQGLTGGSADVIDKIRILDVSAAANDVLVLLAT